MTGDLWALASPGVSNSLAAPPNMATEQQHNGTHLMSSQASQPFKTCSKSCSRRQGVRSSDRVLAKHVSPLSKRRLPICGAFTGASS